MLLVVSDKDFLMWCQRMAAKYVLIIVYDNLSDRDATKYCRVSDDAGYGMRLALLQNCINLWLAVWYVLAVVVAMELDTRWCSLSCMLLLLTMGYSQGLVEDWSLELVAWTSGPVDERESQQECLKLQGCV